jgi:hypothetical protein
VLLSVLIVAFVAAYVLRGWRRGLVVEVVELVGLVAAILAAYLLWPVIRAFSAMCAVGSRSPLHLPPPVSYAGHPLYRFTVRSYSPGETLRIIGSAALLVRRLCGRCIFSHASVASETSMRISDASTSPPGADRNLIAGPFSAPERTSQEDPGPIRAARACRGSESTT